MFLPRTSLKKVLGIVCCCVALAACGGASSGGDDPGSNVPPAPSPPPPPPPGANNAPVVDSPIGSQTATEEQAFSLDVSGHFSDPDGDPLSFSAVGLPVSFTLDASGMLTGTPDAVDTNASPFNVSVTADDGKGGAAEDSFTLTVQPPLAGDVCTEVLGFSQTREWFLNVSLPTWQGRVVGGADITKWADPNNSVWDAAVLGRVCDQNQVERVVSNISGNVGTDWQGNISSVVVNIRDKYPSVQEIVLQPVVGGPNGGECFFGGEQVRATVNFGPINNAIAAVAGGDVLIGLAPTVGDCSHYRDQQGHLSDQGAQFVGDQVTDYYTNEFQGTAALDEDLY